MSITINLKYCGKNGAARAFAEEMTQSGTVAAIRAEDGNEAYDYYISFDNPEVLLLVDQWRDQAAVDAHHSSSMMETVAKLRDKYDLHMEAQRFTPLEDGQQDERFIRR